MGNQTSKELEAQRDSFRAFFEATGGRRWRRKENWEEFLQGVSVSSFYGVTLSGEGSAIDLCIENNELSGATTCMSCSVLCYAFNNAVVNISRLFSPSTIMMFNCVSREYPSGNRAIDRS